MTVRTSQTSDTFTRPFSLSGIDEVQAAGTYTVQLAIDTPDGIVLMVGCSDPTIEKIVEAAKPVIDQPIHPVFDREDIAQRSAALRGAMGREHTGETRAKIDALDQAAMKLGQAMYAEAAGGPGGTQGPGGAAPGEEGAVDAEFEDVNEEEKRRRTG